MVYLTLFLVHTAFLYSSFFSRWLLTVFLSTQIVICLFQFTRRSILLVRYYFLKYFLIISSIRTYQILILIYSCFLCYHLLNIILFFFLLTIFYISTYNNYFLLFLCYLLLTFYLLILLILRSCKLIRVNLLLIIVLHS